ncbi:MAG: hypothetical protein V3V30_03285 [Parvularculaceae bacterium]
MQHLNFRTLDISDQRHHITAGRLFRGFGPLVIGTTGGLALFVTGLQLALPEIFMVTPERFFALWISAAAIATLLVSLEMIARKKHHHGGLADEMVQTTIEQFLPAGFAGAAIAMVFYRFTPETLWALPGLWQILVAIGLFAGLRNLPRSAFWVASWYALSGVTVLIIAGQSNELSPWMMGIPFTIGQLMMATVLKYSVLGDLNSLNDDIKSISE